MATQKLEIEGCYLFTNITFPDERGLFREWFRQEEIDETAPGFKPMQANNSISKKGVIRGIHYSLAPRGQAKLVACASGDITDVLVDLRIGSPTYKKIVEITLTPENGRTVFIASGVGHGFVVESESASVVYLTSSTYAPDFEKGINPLDSELGITWLEPGKVGHIISPQDSQAISLAEAEAQGLLPKF